MNDIANTPKQALYAHLMQAILTLDLAPGEDLDEARLSDMFGLSRTPLREVFRQLAGEGYITLRENRGARVADLGHTTLRDFFLAAPMIYAAILRLAARNATAAQITALYAAQEVFRTTLTTGTAAQRTLANTRFHEITGDMAGNVYLQAAFRRLLIDHARIGMTFYRPKSVGEDTAQIACAQHDMIIDAIARRDEAQAAALADAHWNLSRHQIEQFVLPAGLDQPLGTAPQTLFT